MLRYIIYIGLANACWKRKAVERLSQSRTHAVREDMKVELCWDHELMLLEVPLISTLS
jgi:hypothetical protein